MKFSAIALVQILSVANAFTGTQLNGPKSTSALDMKYRVAVVGGGPSGACAAEVFAQDKSVETTMFERKLDNAKPCGGAIPLCMIGEFNIPEDVVDRKVRPDERAEYDSNTAAFKLNFCMDLYSLLTRVKNIFTKLIHARFLKWIGAQDEPYLPHWS